MVTIFMDGWRHYLHLKNIFLGIDYDVILKAGDGISKDGPTPANNYLYLRKAGGSNIPTPTNSVLPTPKHHLFSMQSSIRS